MVLLGSRAACNLDCVPWPSRWFHLSPLGQVVPMHTNACALPRAIGYRFAQRASGNAMLKLAPIGRARADPSFGTGATATLSITSLATQARVAERSGRPRTRTGSARRDVRHTAKGLGNSPVLLIRTPQIGVRVAP